MGRPKKDPSEKMVKVNLTLRREDLEVLQRLAFEQIVLAFRGDGGTIKAAFEKRPSMSGAIRQLIDAERERHVDQVLASGRRVAVGDNILADDPIFGPSPAWAAIAGKPPGPIWPLSRPPDARKRTNAPRRPSAPASKGKRRR